MCGEIVGGRLVKPEDDTGGEGAFGFRCLGAYQRCAGVLTGASQSCSVS
jgi:hypothetical protein